MPNRSLKQVFLNALATSKDEMERKITFMALFGKELERLGAKLPIIVGGMAVEVFTFGKYSSDDIDIKSDQGKTFFILTQLGFENQGQHLWYSEEMGIIIDWRGASLDEGKDSHDKVLTIKTEIGSLLLAPVEDVLVDRLCAAKFWNHVDSLQWARYIYQLYGKNAQSSLDVCIDEVYLEKRMKEEDVLDIFTQSILP